MAKDQATIMAERAAFRAKLLRDAINVPLKAVGQMWMGAGRIAADVYQSGTVGAGFKGLGRAGVAAWRGGQQMTRDFAALPGALNMIGMSRPGGRIERLFWGGETKEMAEAATKLGRPAMAAGLAETVPGFLARTPMQHLKMGGTRLLQTALSRVAWGIDIATSGYFAFADTETQDLGDPYNGVARKFIGNMAMGPGSIIGMASGAAIGTAITGPIGGIIGGAIGVLGGGSAMSELIDMPFKIAEKGRQMRLNRPMMGTFVDSEAAYTMRQRSIDMIQNSQMNARTALGSEALSYHG